jgi:hypothetical protein
MRSANEGKKIMMSVKANTARFGAVLAGVLMLCLAAPANASIIYNVDRTIGNGTVTGFIETDGTLGQLTTANIIDWGITLTAPNLAGGSPDVIDFATAKNTLISGTATTATPTQLLFDFNLEGSQVFLLHGGSGNLWCLQVETCTPH